MLPLTAAAFHDGWHSEIAAAILPSFQPASKEMNWAPATVAEYKAKQAGKVSPPGPLIHSA